MEIKGIVIDVFGILEGTSKAGKEWSKRDIIIQYGTEYPKKLCLILWNDVAKMSLNSGDEIEATFDPESREYQGRWFTDCKVWKLNVLKTSDGKKCTNQNKQPGSRETQKNYIANQESKENTNSAPPPSDDLPW